MTLWQRLVAFVRGPITLDDLTRYVPQRPTGATYKLGDHVQKKGRSKWRGTVCGFYSTSITPIGYVIESVNEPGSVQLYPEAAVEAWEATT